MDEREMRDRWNEIHEYVTRGADERERNADKRTEVLVRVIETASKMLASTLEKGMNNIASAIRGR